MTTESKDKEPAKKRSCNSRLCKGCEKEFWSNGKGSSPDDYCCQCLLLSQRMSEHFVKSLDD